jgi:hypothetical protein
MSGHCPAINQRRRSAFAMLDTQHTDLDGDFVSLGYPWQICSAQMQAGGESASRLIILLEK